MNSYSRFLSLILFSLILGACSTFKYSDQRAGECNELQSKMIFNGATSNDRRAEIESAEQHLLQQSYDKRCT